MKENSFRRTKDNKAVIAIGIVGLLLLISINVNSFTTTITDSSNDIETRISNSNGKFYEATAANIQIAINNIGSGNRGTVTLPANNTISITTTIDLERNITLDLGASTLIAGAGTRHARVHGIKVRLQQICRHPVRDLPLQGVLQSKSPYRRQRCLSVHR